jgi:hypothetical protein
MLLPLFWGVIVSGLSVATLLWWVIPLHDVSDPTDQPITKLRSLVGQILLVITVVASSTLCQVAIVGVLWRRWVNTDKTLNSRVLFPIASGMNPLLWSWRFINMEIIIAAIYGLLLHVAVGILQTQITVKEYAIAYDELAGWLPMTLDPYQGNLSNTITAQDLSDILAPVAMNAADANIMIGSIANNWIGYQNITQHTNITLHFYTSIPILKAKTGVVSNSTYTMINSTHVNATINSNDAMLCNIVFQRSIDIGTWIGCDVDKYGYVFYDQTSYYDTNNTVLNLNNNSAIRYEVMQQCYHTARVMNGSDRVDFESDCSEPYVRATLGFDNVLEVLLTNLNSVQYLTYSVRNPLESLMYMQTVGSDLEFEIQDNVATVVATFCTWGMFYAVFASPASYIQPFTLEYYTSGDIHNLWFLIVGVPIVLTLATMFNMRTADMKMSKKLSRQYWLLESVMDEGEWKADSRENCVILSNN